MKFQTDGLIIREQNIGENDRLVWVLTRSNGVVKAFARGAKKLDSAKCSATSLLSYSRLTLYKSRENYIVGDAKTLRIFSKLRHDVRKMCLVQYFCEIARHICPREQPADEFLRLFLNSVYLLSENKRGELLVKACFEMRYMCMAGYKPDLLMCRLFRAACLFSPSRGQARMLQLPPQLRQGSSSQRGGSDRSAPHGFCRGLKAVLVRSVGRGTENAEQRHGALPEMSARQGFSGIEFL